MHDVGCPGILTVRRSPYEAQAIQRRADHLALKEYEADGRVPELSRRHGVTENTLYRWKCKFDGMEVSEAIRLRELGAENLTNICSRRASRVVMY